MLRILAIISTSIVGGAAVANVKTLLGERKNPHTQISFDSIIFFGKSISTPFGRVESHRSSWCTSKSTD